MGAFTSTTSGFEPGTLCLERAGICSHVLPVSSFSSILSIRTSRTTPPTDWLISHRQQGSRTLGFGAPRLPAAPFFAGGVSPVGELGSRSRAFFASSFSRVLLSEKGSRNTSKNKVPPSLYKYMPRATPETPGEKRERAIVTTTLLSTSCPARHPLAPWRGGPSGSFALPGPF